MAEDALVRELEQLLVRQDEFVDDTFDVVNAEYERAVREVVGEIRGLVDQVETTDGDRLSGDARRAAEARLVALRSVPLVVTVWERWEQRLRRIARFTDEYFETASGRPKTPSTIENALMDELIGLWPDGNVSGSGMAGQFYQLTTHHRQELANAVTRHVLGRTRKPQLVRELAERTQKSTTQAEQLVRDSTIQFSRTVQASRAQDQGFEFFKYFGPLDRITRPFCSPLVGKIFSREEIDAMDNNQTGTGSVMTAGGGYNCRHHWQPVRREWFSDADWDASRGEP